MYTYALSLQSPLKQGHFFSPLSSKNYNNPGGLRNEDVSLIRRLSSVPLVSGLEKLDYF